MNLKTATKLYHLLFITELSFLVGMLVAKNGKFLKPVSTMVFLNLGAIPIVMPLVLILSVLTLLAKKLLMLLSDIVNVPMNLILILKNVNKLTNKLNKNNLIIITES